MCIFENWNHDLPAMQDSRRVVVEDGLEASVMTYWSYCNESVHWILRWFPPKKTKHVIHHTFSKPYTVHAKILHHGFGIQNFSPKIMVPGEHPLPFMASRRRSRNSARSSWHSWSHEPTTEVWLTTIRNGGLPYKIYICTSMYENSPLEKNNTSPRKRIKKD